MDTSLVERRPRLAATLVRALAITLTLAAAAPTARAFSRSARMGRPTIQVPNTYAVKIRSAAMAVMAATVFTMVR